jgi:hypothetical protein
MTPKGPRKDDRAPDEGVSAQELAHAREVLERTMRFLARCSEDPDAAVQAEDPRELIRDLRALTPPPPDAAKELPSFPLKKRRSA